MILFPQCLTLLVQRQEEHPACKEPGCWVVGGDDLNGALQTSKECTQVDSAMSMKCSKQLVHCTNASWNA